jgi:mono/diheme cytochrome c family protein
MEIGKGIVIFVVLIGVGLSGAAWADSSANAMPSRGEQMYSQFCATCHGRYGRGDGPLAPNLRRQPPDFTDSTWIAGRTDDAIVKSLAGSAHGPMALGSILKPEAMVDAVAFIRTLSVPGQHVSVPAGRDIYNATCWQCHGATGDGNGPVAKFLAGAQPRDFTASTFVIDGREDAIVQFITIGAEKVAHGSPYMPEWASRLSPQQIRDTVEYLKTFKKTPQIVIRRATLTPQEGVSASKIDPLP